ncbi:hypothetical protein HOV56_gp40 [Nitrosopumilus spindle-shaped virus]|uniref:Uncharacterized protein n=1 Tax=Nitrosopumilus spindle-shaped virus TaxID=2508184 RepID=A0A514K2S7_9VIRU|nr:hypothetical protein HOV56_gp40 [Nitrosopumilus spindle-shaped virus]QDI73929.1 hypothetical protein [Nitrosopumilus spindle-shaped virus]
MSLLKREFLILNLIIWVSFVIKIYFIDVNVKQDNYDYFILAKNYAETNSIEVSRYIHNIGLILLHGLFFKVIEPLFYTHILITCIFSSISLYFAFFFLRKFLNFKYAILGLLLLAFNFRIVQNATLGVTEPLFFTLVWASLYFSLSTYKLRVVGIVLSLFSILVRFEGIVVLFYCIVNYILYFEKLKYLLVTLFVFPISNISTLINYKTIETKSNEVLGVFETHAKHEIVHLESMVHLQFGKIVNSVVYFGWSLFPEFLLFIPFGLYAVYKKKIGKSILFWIFVFALPGLWAYLDAYDTRYFMLSYLFIDLLCIFGIKEVVKKLKS